MAAFAFDRLADEEKVDLADKKGILLAERVGHTDEGSVGSVGAEIGVDLRRDSDRLGQGEGVASPLEVSAESFGHPERGEVEEVVVLPVPTEGHLRGLVLVEVGGELDDGQPGSEVVGLHSIINIITLMRSVSY